MERFFYGVFVGFLFSSAFYVLGLFVAQSNQKQRWGIKYFSIEFVLVFIAVGAMSWLWGDRFDWIPRYLVPVEYIQIILGVGTGVFTRVWLTRLIADSRILPQAPATPPPSDPRPVKDGKTPDRPSALWQDRYGWTIGFLAILLIAVLLPYLEDMVKQMSTLKVAGIEVTLRTEQRSSYLANLPYTRDSLISGFLEIQTLDGIRERLESDRRMINDKAKADTRLKADEEYLTLYKDVLFPYLSCLVELLDQGWDINTVRDDTRVVVNEWFSIAHTTADEATIRKHFKKLINAAYGSLKKWSNVEPGCKGQQAATVQVGPRVKDSFEFYRQLTGLLYFLDNRLGAIQNMERVGSRFREEMNRFNFLGILYYAEDPTLTKSAEYYERALTVAQRGFESAKTRMSTSSISCPDPHKGKASKPICFDYKRFKNATILFKSNTAYAYAQSNRGNLARARQIAREALKTYTEGLSSKSTPSTDETLSNDTKLWGYIDTYAYVALAASVRSAIPDTKVIACAEKAFGHIAEHASKALDVVMQQGDEKGFSTRFSAARYSVEVFTSHRALAASLLANTRGASCSEEDLGKMQKGDL